MADPKIETGDPVSEINLMLSRPLSDAHADHASESDWLMLCLLRLESGRLGVADPTLFNDDGNVVVVLPAAAYAVQVKLWDWGDDRRVSRLRVVPEQDIITAESLRRGDELGDVGVDFGQVAVCDFDLCLAATDILDPETEQAFFATLDVLDLCGVAVLDTETGALMPFVRPGLGDGIYPVFELTLDGARLGAEVIFLGDEVEPTSEKFRVQFPAFADYLASQMGGPVGQVLPPLSLQELAHLEAGLGVPLPLSYQNFLQLTRGLSVGDGLQLDGIHPFFHEFGPWESLTQRQQRATIMKQSSWPPPSAGMLCFSEFWITGDGDQVLFDVSGGLVDGEYPVYYYDHEQPAVHRIADSFREWLEEIVTGQREVRFD